MDKPITIELLIDDEEQAIRLQQITPEQRKKIYALFRDIASYTGNTPENEKRKHENLIYTTHTSRTI